MSACPAAAAAGEGGATVAAARVVSRPSLACSLVRSLSPASLILVIREARGASDATTKWRKNATTAERERCLGGVPLLSPPHSAPISTSAAQQRRRQNANENELTAATEAKLLAFFGGVRVR